MTAQELIKAALRAIGAIASGETPSSEELQDSLEALNLMLDSWSAERLIVYENTTEGFSLVSGQASYTIGSGGDFDTTRPTRILGAYIRDSSDIDHPVDVFSAKEYREISSKTTQSRPTELYYKPSYPKGTIYLYPVPETVETLYLESLKPLTEFSSLTTDVNLPGPYKRALKWNLAVELAPEFEATVSDVVAVRAQESKGVIKRLNAANQVEPVVLEILKVTRRYNIDEG